MGSKTPTVFFRHRTTAGILQQHGLDPGTGERSGRGITPYNAAFIDNGWIAAAASVVASSPAAGVAAAANGELAGVGVAAVLAAASCGFGIGLVADAFCIDAVGNVVGFGVVQTANVAVNSDVDVDLVTADDVVCVVVAAFVAAADAEQHARNPLVWEAGTVADARDAVNLPCCCFGSGIGCCGGCMCTCCTLRLGCPEDDIRRSVASPRRNIRIHARSFFLVNK
mmetsp:Transcript_20155/g.23168  ORF Transcript_20155/g.23168 Transcript_20155/m.23168 type:complete len:225 (-) Transcript_20155:42-716(-)